MQSLTLTLSTNIPHGFSGDGISGGEHDQEQENMHGKERSRKMSVDDSGPEEAKCRKHGAKKQQKTEEGKEGKGERGGKDGQQKNQQKDGQQNKERSKGKKTSSMVYNPGSSSLRPPTPP